MSPRLATIAVSNMSALCLVILVAVGCGSLVKGANETEEINLQEISKGVVGGVVKVEETGVESRGRNVSSEGVVSKGGAEEVGGVRREVKDEFESKEFVVRGGVRFGSVEDVSRQEITVGSRGKFGVDSNEAGGNNESVIGAKPSWGYNSILPLSNDTKSVVRNNRVAELQGFNEKNSETVKSPVSLKFEPQMERISEPLLQSPSQSQRINLQLPVLNTSGVFRPSPELQLPVYEFNRFPVVPAHPEPKSFGKVDVWATKVRFPKPEVPVTVKDFPYPYASQKNFPVFPQEFQGFDDKKFIRKPDVIHEVVEEERMNTDLTSSPWKKVIKILTAFIPIGLLISALTPSVITISPMNGTYARGRANLPKPVALDLLSQLHQDGCDERIFCEILLSAEETKQSKSDAANLLKNYAKGNKEGKSAKILKAVKSGNCDGLRCDGMKKN